MRIIEQREVPGLATLYLAELPGGRGRLVEFVDTLEPGVPKSEKWVMMISTQVGCAVGCRMCDAGGAGYQGDLSADEMLGQIRFIAARNRELDLARHPKVKIHFARMGEPALNPAVLEALRALSREIPNPGIIASISTVAPKSPAVAPWFEGLLRIKDECFPNGCFQLQFSLHATDDDLRHKIVPIKKWSLEEIAEYGRRFVRRGDRKVTLNFAPGPGEILESSVVARIFDPEHFLIKVTPVNPTLSAGQSRTTNVWSEPPEPVRKFADDLRRRGCEVIISPSMEEELRSETSCGQLWSQTLKTAAVNGRRAEERERCSYVTVDSMAEKAKAWMRQLDGPRPRVPAFAPETAALLVIDMQEFFLDRGSPAYLPPGRAALLNTRRLAEAFRSAGRPVLLSVHAHRDRAEDGGLMALWWDKVCLADSPLARAPAVLEAPECDVYRKTGYSAFTNPSLVQRLRNEGVSQLVLAGVKTDLCVESTARAAFDLGWASFVVTDATAAKTEEQHVAALRAMARGFAVVTLADDIVKDCAVVSAACPVGGFQGTALECLQKVGFPFSLPTPSIRGE
jgi:23S rRNA (adenine2503-C2)-methyltransferase